MLETIYTEFEIKRFRVDTKNLWHNVHYQMWKDTLW